MVKLFSSVSYNLVRGNLAPETFGSASAPDGVGSSLVAVAGDQIVSLTWDASAGATSYKVYASLTNVFGTALEVTESPTIGPALDVSTGLQAGEMYYFWVVATNAVGDSGESASDSARPYVTLANIENANLTTPTGTWTFGTLFFGRSPATFPDYFNLTSGINNYFTYEGLWLDANTEADCSALAISGDFTVSNGSGVSITFWNGEP